MDFAKWATENHEKDSANQACNVKAIVGLTLGIAGVLTIVGPFAGIPIAIVGIILSIEARRKPHGHKMAVSGLVLCLIGLVLNCVIIALNSYLMKKNHQEMLQGIEKIESQADSLRRQMEMSQQDQELFSERLKGQVEGVSSQIERLRNQENRGLPQNETAVRSLPSGGIQKQDREVESDETVADGMENGQAKGDFGSTAP